MERKKPTQMEVTELYVFGSWNGKKDIAFCRREEMDELSSEGQRVMLIHPFHPVSPFLTLRGRVGKGMVSGGGENFNPVVPS